MSRDDAALADILRALRRIEDFTQAIDSGSFASDIEKQSAVLHQRLVLGEAVRRLSPDFRERHPSIPWAKMMAMRNLLIHSYDRVDLQIVWDTVEQELPPLLASVEPLLSTDG